MEALEARFCNDTGFNYVAFLQELQPSEKLKLMYLERQREVREVNQRKKLPEKDPGHDLETILHKIKTMVCPAHLVFSLFMSCAQPMHCFASRGLCQLTASPSQVFKERMRILEWMKDYDKLRSARMLKVNFRRALDLCKFELRESELAILEDQ